MSKLHLDDVTSLQSEPSALQTMAANNRKIEQALENTLSRNGELPNQMEAPLDLNGHQVINVGPPLGANDLVRLRDLQDSLSIDEALIPTLDAGKVLSNDGTAMVWLDITSVPGLGDMKSANNLSEVDPASARANLGLGSSSIVDVGTSGAYVGLLDGNNTHSGTNTFQGAVTLGGTANHQITSNAAPTTNSIGRRVPRTNVRDANYTIALTDASDCILHTAAAAHTWTIPPDSSANFPGNTQILLLNPGSGNVNLARGSGVSLKINGGSTSKNGVIVQDGVVTLIKVQSNSWVAVGPGIS